MSEQKLNTYGVSAVKVFYEDEIRRVFAGFVNAPNFVDAAKTGFELVQDTESSQCVAIIVKDSYGRARTVTKELVERYDRIASTYGSSFSELFDTPLAVVLKESKCLR